jgi:hypothetical protein
MVFVKITKSGYLTIRKTSSLDNNKKGYFKPHTLAITGYATLSPVTRSEMTAFKIHVICVKNFTLFKRVLYLYCIHTLPLFFFFYFFFLLLQLFGHSSVFFPFIFNFKAAFFAAIESSQLKGEIKRERSNNIKPPSFNSLFFFFFFFLFPFFFSALSTFFITRSKPLVLVSRPKNTSTFLERQGRERYSEQ